MNSGKSVTFALLCIFIAVAFTGWEEVTYSMTPAQKRGWFIAACILVLGTLAWLLRPCWQWMFIN